MRKRIAVALLAGLIPLVVAHDLSASDTWAFRFSGVSGPMYTTSWHDDLSFHNATDQDAVVRLLGISNGDTLEGDLLEIPIAAGRTVSLSDLFGVWEPDEFPSVWVVRFDVPDGVIVSSRGGADSECPSPCGAPPNLLPDLGAFTMPVFRSLAPANTRQFHFGADLGTQPSRSNVGIYNAGDAPARATISLYRACDDTLLGVRTVTVPANFALQAGIGGVAEPAPCANPQKLNVWLRYVTVVVDQPSLTYVFNIVEDPPVHARIPFGIAGF